MLTLDKIRELQERHSYDRNIRMLSEYSANTTEAAELDNFGTLVDAARECTAFLESNIALNISGHEKLTGDTLRSRTFDFGKSNKRYRLALQISYEEQEVDVQDDYMSFEFVLERCQDFIAKSFRERRDERDKLERTKAYISDFVYNLDSRQDS